VNQAAARAIDAAQKRLETAKFGLADLRAHPERFDSGVMNTIVFGRMVTFALQNMRGHVDGFNEWYDVEQERLRSDPLMKYFNDLRTEIEKQIGTVTDVRTEIENWGPGSMEKFGPPPPGATALFIGDQTGRAGWEVQAPDGSVEKYYVDMPPSVGRVTVLFPGAPGSTRERSAPELLQEFLDTLAALIERARSRFV
jgi:hypothetical protein